MAIGKHMIVGKPEALKYPPTFRRMAINSQAAAFQKLAGGKLNDRPLFKNRDIFIDLPQRPETKAQQDNWFVIPKWRAVAETLPKAIAFMARALEVESKSFLEGYSLDKLEQSERTREALEVFSENQEGDFWVISAQLGFFYRGESPASSLEKMPAVEFGFDLYLALAALVSHRGRLIGGDELGINCVGNESLSEYGSPKVPCLSSSLGKMRCLMNRVSEPNPRYGSATGAMFIRAF